MPNANQRTDGDQVERLLGASARPGLAGLFARLVWRVRVLRGAGRREARVERAVMARLPEGRPEIYRAVARLVVRAWTDPALRAEFRAHPIAFLSSHGVELPDATRVEFVALDQVALPSRSAVFIPFPRDDRRALSEAEARAELAESGWRWLLGVPEGGADAVGVSRAKDEEATGWIERDSADPPRGAKMFGFPRSGTLAVGAVAAAIGVVWIAAGGTAGLEGGAGLSGTAERAPGVVLWAGLAAITAVVAIAAWLASRR